MGFFFRQSTRLGPFRINFSKSGIGVSTGIPGFRIGTGPRGAYIFSGAKGFYYRQSLGRRGAEAARPSATPSPAVQNRPAVPSPDVTLGEERIIDSGSVLAMTDSSADDLLQELNACRKRTVLWPVALFGVGVACALLFLTNADRLVVVGVLVLGGIGTAWVYGWDIQRKGFVLQYGLDGRTEACAKALVSAFERLQGVASAWYLQSTREVRQRKYHAGADNVVRRSATRVAFGEPPYLRVNIPVPALPVGKETLYFLPDRLLIYGADGIGAVAYRDLKVDVRETHFIEGERVPRDAEVVDRTWRYVNKSGGPDRRFKDNVELPVCRYEELTLTAASGLHEALQLSKCGLGKPFADIVRLLTTAVEAGGARASAPRIQSGREV